MDVDNNSVEAQTGGGGAIDIEQSLLHQFSCMGTTDKDELVSQFQKLLGTQLNYSTAAFFLDMNNWNLQASICSYFDVENSSKLPSMTLVSNPQACESENIETNKSFTKVWNIVNSGTETWPEGCYAQIAAGDLLKSEKVPVPCLAPGQNGVLIVTMQSPQTPGTYQSKWRLCTRSGSYFGDPMWVILTVVEESTMALTNQLSHLSDLGATPAHSVPVNPFRTTEHLQEDKAGPACIGLITIHFTKTEKEALVDLHNTFRNKVASGQVQLGTPGPQPMAANMRMIEWSEELAVIARRWAAQCIYGHDICRDLDRFPVGQNIAKGIVARSTEIFLVEEWFDNVKFFNNSLVESFKLFQRKKQKISQYSQVVWADTYLLGCARAIFQHSTSSNISYKEHLICNYGPTGNIPNQPVYKIGEPCSKCQEGTSCFSTYPALCASEEVYEMLEHVEDGTHRNYYSAVLSVLMLSFTIIFR